MPLFVQEFPCGRVVVDREARGTEISCPYVPLDRVVDDQEDRCFLCSPCHGLPLGGWRKRCPLIIAAIALGFERAFDLPHGNSGLAATRRGKLSGRLVPHDRVPHNATLEWQ